MDEWFDGLLAIMLDVQLKAIAKIAWFKKIALCLTPCVIYLCHNKI